MALLKAHFVGGEVTAVRVVERSSQKAKVAAIRDNDFDVDAAAAEGAFDRGQRGQVQVHKAGRWQSVGGLEYWADILHAKPEPLCPRPASQGRTADHPDAGRSVMPSDSPPSPRARRLVAPAIELYGERWQSRLARVPGVSQSHLQKIADGSRAVTDAVEDLVRGAYKKESDRSENAATRRKRLMARIIAVAHGRDVEEEE